MTNDSEINQNQFIAHKRCFISAPMAADLSVLKASLEVRGIQVQVPRDLAIGTSWAGETQKQISKSDLVIGVLTSDAQSYRVLFELGQAAAFARRIIIICPPNKDPMPMPLDQFLVLRIDLNNQEAIDFALDQFLAAPEQQSNYSNQKPAHLAGIGDKADELLKDLEDSIATKDWQALENITKELLQLSGVDVVVDAPLQNTRVDFAVWSDVWEPFVGNPLIIELKATTLGIADLENAVQQVTHYLHTSSSRWGLLLFGDGTDFDNESWAKTSPNVLVLSLKTLIENMRTRSLPEIVRDLRNQRVHKAV